MKYNFDLERIQQLSDGDIACWFPDETSLRLMKPVMSKALPGAPLPVDRAVDRHYKVINGSWVSTIDDGSVTSTPAFGVLEFFALHKVDTIELTSTQIDGLIYELVSRQEGKTSEPSELFIEHFFVDISLKEDVLDDDVLDALSSKLKTDLNLPYRVRGYTITPDYHTIVFCEWSEGYIPPFKISNDSLFEGLDPDVIDVVLGSGC